MFQMFPTGIFRVTGDSTYVDLDKLESSAASFRILQWSKDISPDMKNSRFAKQRNEYNTVCCPLSSIHWEKIFFLFPHNWEHFLRPEFFNHLGLTLLEWFVINFSCSLCKRVGILEQSCPSAAAVFYIFYSFFLRSLDILVSNCFPYPIGIIIMDLML